MRYLLGTKKNFLVKIFMLQLNPPPPRRGSLGLTVRILLVTKKNLLVKLLLMTKRNLLAKLLLVTKKHFFVSFHQEIISW